MSHLFNKQHYDGVYMHFEFNIGDTVNVSKEALNNNNANLDMDYDGVFVVTKRLDIGEPAYNLRNVNTGDKVYIREDVEYNFIDEELVMVISNECN